MKSIFLIALLLGASAASATQLSEVRTCRTEAGSPISLLAEKGLEGSRLYLKLDGQIKTAFTDMPDADFVGTVVMSTCAGHALIFAISYGPPYLKGVVVRRNPVNHAVERIDFAEKSLPRWLYLSPTQMRLVIPNIGNETASKYLIYDFASVKGQSNEPAASNVLPDKHGFNVAQLRSH